MQYRDAIDYLLALPDSERFSSGAQAQTMSLASMKELLRRLDNPHLGRKTIHITGSKGKGSTATYAAQILHAAGFNIALFTSPHLCDYTERICFNTEAVSQIDFAAGVEEMRYAIDSMQNSDQAPISTFGALLALFFILCRGRNPIWQIVEVGMGGVEDATNVFESKEAAVITSISLEHTAILGDTCDAIAENKAGIVTPGCITILAEQKHKSVREVVARRCSAVGATLIDVEQNYTTHLQTFDSRAQSFTIDGPTGRHDLSTSLLGTHQIANATTAVAIADFLSANGVSLPPAAIAAGIGNAHLAGRLESIGNRPTIVIDGAHNPDSFCSLAQALSAHFSWHNLYVVLGVNADKNIRDMIGELLPLNPHLILCSASSNSKAMPPEKVAQAVSERQLPLEVCSNIITAVDRTLSIAEPDDLICITGSLYVAGEARRYILPN